MRRLVCFSIGFSIACAIGAYLLSDLWLVGIGIILAALAVLLCFFKEKHRCFKVALVILIGCIIGAGWFCTFDWCYVDTARCYDGENIDTVVEITDYSFVTDYGVVADGEICLDKKNYRVCVYLYEEIALSPGDEIHGEFKLHFTGNGERNTYHQSEGIFLLAYAAENVSVVQRTTIQSKYFAVVLKREIQNIIDRVFPDDTVAFAKALLLGDSSELTYEVDTSLKISGIRHVIAVSGLHVSILFSFVYQLCGKWRFMTAVFGIPVLILFAAVAGFTPSVVRACIMQGLMILALLVNKEYDSPTALAFAVLVMITSNPLVITSVSFQLSAGCMIGIFLFSERIKAYLLDTKRLGRVKGKSVAGRMIRWIVSSVSISVSAMLVTTPLSAYYFGMVSLVSILTNLLTLWMISAVFYGIIAAVILGAFWLPAGKAAAFLISWAMRYVLGVAEWMADFPVAAVYTDSIYVLLWLVMCYVMLAAFLVYGVKRPVLLGGCITLGLLFSLLLSWLEPRSDDFRVSVLDVGQGQCILLQSDGANYLVDCGGDTGEIAADKAARTLLSQGVMHLDGIILTHYDKDHAGGVVPLLSRIEADCLYLPSISDRSEIRNTLATMYGDNICWVTDITILKDKDMKITLFPGENDKDDNESCMCVLFQAENCDILITGDRTDKGERFLLEQGALPELELLVVGHHGSASSTSFDLLAATKPKNAVISVGAGNAYGHPNEKVLKRLYLFGCVVQRTDLDGTIVYRG